jgi:TonB family protein
MAVSHEKLSNGESATLRAAVPHLRDIVRVVGPLDATLPPTPVRDLLAASGATVFVLATDASLVATIRRAADQHPLFVVETWAELKQAVESGSCGIALLDAALLGSRVAECVATLAAYSDRLVTLVAADRAAAQEYVGFLSNGRIHRLLIKPPAVGAARLLIESATARRLQLREVPANEEARDAEVAAVSRVPRWIWGAAAAASVAVLVGTAIAGGRLGWWDRFATVEPRATTGAAAVVTGTVPTTAEQLADYRTRAELARQEGRLAEPVGDNALDHYLAILALAPTDQPARDGVSSVVDTLFGRAEESLLVGSLEGAAAALDHVRRVDPASSRLAFLDAQLARGLAALAVSPSLPTAEAAAPAATPTELDSVLNLAAARLRRGQLLSPAGDSARAYLDRATELGRTDPRVAELRRDLAAALIAAARLVADADVAAATSLAAEAGRLGAEPALLAALESELTAVRARESQQRLEIARARVRSGALFAPAGDSALDQLARLQADAPDLPGLAEAWEALRQAGVLATQGALETRNWTAADTQLAGLAQVPGGVAVAAPLAADLAAGRLQESYLATAGLASELRVQSSVPVVYPPDALARGIEGWVDLEYVVDRTGQPRNLVVVQSSPQGRFDAAALAAVEQHRYVPFEVDGRVYERRLRQRVRFLVRNVQ